MFSGENEIIILHCTHHAFPDSPAVSADRGPPIRGSHADLNATYITCSDGERKGDNLAVRQKGL